MERSKVTGGPCFSKGDNVRAIYISLEIKLPCYIYILMYDTLELYTRTMCVGGVKTKAI